MNERGEIISLSILLILALSSLLLLSSLELRRSFLSLRNRSQLFLCTKEFKGELEIFLTQIGRTNWVIKNLDHLSKGTLFIPGLQGISLKSKKAKRMIILYQNTQLISYLKKLAEIKRTSCPIPLESFKTPYHISLKGFTRDNFGGALLRNTQLAYTLSLGEHTLSLTGTLSQIESLRPKVRINSSEKRGKQFSPSFSL